MQRTVAKRAVVVALVTMGALGLAGNPASASPAGSSGDDNVVTYESTGALVGSETITITGKATSNGGCTFDMPQVELAPNETAIQARQVETNFSTCTTKVEVGTPKDVAATKPSTTSVTETAKAGSPAVANGLAASAAPSAKKTVRSTDAAARIAAVQSTGYYRIWWEDIINLDVHEVKSNIRWSWDNYNCVWGYSGWSNYSWLTASGWSKNSSAQALFPSCGLVETTSVAVYRNGAFCWPGVVWSYYDNVRAQGRWDGWLLGSVDNTYTTYPFACPTLHWNSELRRTQN